MKHLGDVVALALIVAGAVVCVTATIESRCECKVDRKED